jgi:hypothetical protein
MSTVMWNSRAGKHLRGVHTRFVLATEDVDVAFQVSNPDSIPSQKIGKLRPIVELLGTEIIM